MSFDDLRFRSITLKFAAENLLDRTDDAVAISCDKEFTLRAGIGRAFINRGDHQFKNDVTQLHITHQTISDPMAVSVAGNGLNCRHLILAPLRQFFRNNFEDVFCEVLQCAIQLNVTALALPPLGSGGYNMDRSDVANALKFALETQANFGSLTQITIVDSSTNSVRYFRNALENMVADDLLANPNFYPSSNNAVQPISGPLNIAQQIATNTPFSMFYNALELDKLNELREQHIKDKMDIDTQNRDEEEPLEACSICLRDMLELSDDYKMDDDFTIVQLNRCVHLFHRQCLVSWFENKAQCPICNTTYVLQNGNQPTNGTMNYDYVRGRLPGYTERTHIRITYNFPNGVQGDGHPRPGIAYKGTKRVCYLPATSDGEAVLRLLEEAFRRRLVFTVGDSVTTGQQNVVTWNGIHHKTNKIGGPQNYGYPDPNYLDRVKQELITIGITDNLLQLDDTMDSEDDD